MGEQRVKKIKEKDILAAAEKSLKDLEEKQVKIEEKKIKKAKPVSGKITKKRVRQPRLRSRKYQEVIALFDRSKFYDLSEAIDLAKKTSYVKFDASIELHLRLLSNKKSEFPSFRKLINLPYRIGKEPKIGVIDEAMIEKINREKKTDYDILLARPEIMPKLAKIAKILGPQGKMPNPKAGTITQDPQKTIGEIKAGKIEIKTDNQGIIHQIIGKVSWDNQKIKDNTQAVIALVPPGQIGSMTLCSSMGPGIKVKL